MHFQTCVAFCSSCVANRTVTPLMQLNCSLLDGHMHCKEAV